MRRIELLKFEHPDVVDFDFVVRSCYAQAGGARMPIQMDGAPFGLLKSMNLAARVRVVNSHRLVVRDSCDQLSV